MPPAPSNSRGAKIQRHYSQQTKIDVEKATMFSEIGLVDFCDLKFETARMMSHWSDVYTAQVRIYIQGQVHPGEVSSWSHRDYTHSVFLFFSFPPFFPEALKIKFLWNGPYLSTVFYRHRIYKSIVRVKVAQYSSRVADCWGHCQRFYRI